MNCGPLRYLYMFSQNEDLVIVRPPKLTISMLNIEKCIFRDKANGTRVPSDRDGLHHDDLVSNSMRYSLSSNTCLVFIPIAISTTSRNAHKGLLSSSHRNAYSGVASAQAKSKPRFLPKHQPPNFANNSKSTSRPGRVRQEIFAAG